MVNEEYMKRNGLRCLSFYAMHYCKVSRKHCGGEYHRGVSADTLTIDIVKSDFPRRGGRPLPRIPALREGLDHTLMLSNYRPLYHAPFLSVSYRLDSYIVKKCRVCYNHRKRV
jgi:hypothetical protein